MCRGKFKKSGQKGFSLDELYDALGFSKDIHSTLVGVGEEDANIAAAELYLDNPIVDGWNDIITREKGRIWWEDFYNLDVESRKQVPIKVPVQVPVQVPIDVPTQVPDIIHKAMEERLMKAMEEGFQRLDKKIDGMSTRLKYVEDLVLNTGGDDYWDVQEGTRGGEEDGVEEEAGVREEAGVEEEAAGVEDDGVEEEEAGQDDAEDGKDAGEGKAKDGKEAVEEKVTEETEDRGPARRAERPKRPSRFCKTPYKPDGKKVKTACKKRGKTDEKEVKKRGKKRVKTGEEDKE